MDDKTKTEFIRNKWRDPDYRGCFSGITTLTRMLNEDFSHSFSKREVIAALSTEPAFVNRVNNKKKFQRRRYDIQHVFDTWSADLTFMKRVRSFIGFLMCVDIGSRKIYTRLLTNKRATTVKKLLKEIFEEDCEGFKPQKLITDAGTEFVGLKKFFKDEGIFLKVIRTDVKASIPERYIGIVKQRLYKAMESLDTTDWPKLLYKIVASINATENPAIGNLRPDSIKTPFDDHKLVAKSNERAYKQDHWYTQINNQEAYESNSNNIQRGDLVLVNEREKDKKQFRKGYMHRVSAHIFYY